MGDLNALRDLTSLIADDGFAMTFQTQGQYRTALLKRAVELLREPPADNCVRAIPVAAND